MRCTLGEWKPAKPGCYHPSSMPGSSSHHPHHSDNSSHHHSSHLFDLPSDQKGGEGGGDQNTKRRSVWLDLGIQTHLNSNGKVQCGRPPKERGTIVYYEGRPVDFETDHQFPDAGEVMYRCANGNKKTKSRWKVICNDGTWTKNPNMTCGKLLF